METRHTTIYHESDDLWPYSDNCEVTVELELSLSEGEPRSYWSPGYPAEAELVDAKIIIDGAELPLPEWLEARMESEIETATQEILEDHEW